MKTQTEALEAIRDKVSALFPAPAPDCVPAPAPPYVSASLVFELSRLAVEGLQCVPLTPAQRVADQLLAAAIAYEELLGSNERERNGFHYVSEEMDALRALLEPLRPPVPPTLEEALEVLRNISVAALLPGSVEYRSVRELLARVPRV